MKKICLLVFMCILLVGCSTSIQTIEDEGLAKGTFIVTPTSLFETAELKKLEPHLDMKSGCIEIQYKGDKEWIQTKYEIWEEGKLKDSYGDFGIRVAYPNENKSEYNGLISISIKDNFLLDDFKTAPKMIMTTAIDRSSFRTIIDRYDLDYGSSVYNLLEPVVGKDTEEVAAWALIGIDNKQDEGYSPEPTIEDTVKKSDWALVLKVYFK